MDYKYLMGYGKKKKVIKEKTISKPKKTVLDGIKQELNEWSHLPPTEKRWSKKYNGDKGLTEFEETGGKDTIKEVGAAPLYRKHIKNIDKQRDQVGRETLKFVDILRKKGLVDVGDEITDSFKNNIVQFRNDKEKIIRKLM